MTVEELDYSNLDRYYFENVNNIGLIDIIKIEKDTFNKIDLIMFQYYEMDQAMLLLPLVLTFNNLPDITNIPIDTVLKIPELYSLLENLILLDEDDELLVQGISSMGYKKQTIAEDKTQTVALPKLNISLPKITYDGSSGIIKY